MSLSIGIVGLPNVGKSTLFNALTKSKQASAENYPFCTIDPNVGVVEVPDERLKKLSEVSKSKKTVPTTIRFVDIAGLVKGASEGAGLGNQFLSHIREVDAIAHVVRAFGDTNIIHVNNKIDPKDDASTINLELVLADLQTVQKRLEKTKKNAKGVVPEEIRVELSVLEKLKICLESGKMARELDFSEEEKPVVRGLQLLTTKPMMYILNIDENQIKENEYSKNLPEGVGVVEVSAKTETELAELSEEEAREYMREIGMQKSGLDKIIEKGYELLGLITYFTSGEPETRAWTVEKNTSAPLAAGVIHTDFVKGFIRADVCWWQDFVGLGGWAGVRENGKLRTEGKDYIVKDGDVCYFHVN